MNYSLGLPSQPRPVESAASEYSQPASLSRATLVADSAQPGGLGVLGELLILLFKSRSPSLSPGLGLPRFLLLFNGVF